MLKLNKTHWIVLAVGAIVGFLSGFFTAKGIYDKPIEESVTRDTVTLYDTIPDYHPMPKDSAHIKYVTKWLPRAVYDTIVKTDVITCHDSVLVEVPITSKHYGNENYDAWVSGFEPSLDSIKVYQKETLITEIRTISKPPNKWELDIVGGIDYNTAKDKYSPYAIGELLYKPNRFQVGIQGGIVKNEKVEPIVGVKAKIRLL